MVKILALKRMQRNSIKQMHTLDSLVIKIVVISGQIDRLMLNFDDLIDVKPHIFEVNRR